MSGVKSAKEKRKQAKKRKRLGKPEAKPDVWEQDTNPEKVHS
jgi:hypothetical protein